MAAPLAIEAGDVVTNADLNDFLGYPSFEQQVVFAFERLRLAQSAYNTTDPPPDPLINRVGLAPGEAAVTGQMTCLLSANAATVPVWEAVQDIGVGATPFVAEAGDTVTNDDVNNFLAIPTLEGQIAWLTAQLEAREQAQADIDPANAISRVRVLINYDSRTAGFIVALPYSGATIADSVGTYLP